MDKIGIVNLALLAIGADKLTSMTDASKKARLANTIYDHCENYVYELEDWHFLTTRAELSQLTDPDIGKYDHRYAYPSNCKRLVATIDEEDDEIEFGWEREIYISGSNKHNCMLCSEDEVFVRYLVGIGEAGIGMFPDWFCRLISLQIALFLVQPIVTGGQGNNNPLYYKLKDMWKEALDNARTQNARDKVEVNAAGIRSEKGNQDILSAPTDSLTGARTIIDRVKVLDTD